MNEYQYRFCDIFVIAFDCHAVTVSDFPHIIAEVTLLLKKQTVFENNPAKFTVSQ